MFSALPIGNFFLPVKYCPQLLLIGFCKIFSDKEIKKRGRGELCYVEKCL